MDSRAAVSPSMALRSNDTSRPSWANARAASSSPMSSRSSSISSPYRLIPKPLPRSEEHTSELQSLMRISYAVFCLKKNNPPHQTTSDTHNTHLTHNIESHISDTN